MLHKDLADIILEKLRDRYYKLKMCNFTIYDHNGISKFQNHNHFDSWFVGKRMGAGILNQCLMHSSIIDPGGSQIVMAYGMHYGTAHAGIYVTNNIIKFNYCQYSICYNILQPNFTIDTLLFELQKYFPTDQITKSLSDNLLSENYPDFIERVK